MRFLKVKQLRHGLDVKLIYIGYSSCIFAYVFIVATDCSKVLSTCTKSEVLWANLLHRKWVERLVNGNKWAILLVCTTILLYRFIQIKLRILSLSCLNSLHCGFASSLTTVVTPIIDGANCRIPSCVFPFNGTPCKLCDLCTCISSAQYTLFEVLGHCSVPCRFR